MNNDQDFTTTILVDQTPKEVFDAVNNVRGWWSENIDGDTDKAGEVFLYHYQDVHSTKMKIVQLVPYKKVLWLVEQNHFNFIKDDTEWVGSNIIFDITKQGEKTQLRFAHHGLVPAYECYKVCFDAWTNYICQSLYKLITTGKGEPTLKDESSGFDAQLLKKWSQAQ